MTRTRYPTLDGLRAHRTPAWASIPVCTAARLAFSVLALKLWEEPLRRRLSRLAPASGRG
ncbi:hypothetical protein [Phenylobacterium sp.]|uniref:hypothetical protein n=1 Tax=Phenylobacterium sp. TaxID=1871053 RepID=UPI0035AFBA14